jgi:RNA polymerase sigma-70 factor (ECF subfamily)
MNQTAEAPAAIDFDPEEGDWVNQARRGSPVAWEALVRRYQDAVFRLAYLVLRDGGEAEDVAQETFVRAYLALERFESGRPLRPWLMRIAINLARNRRRSIGRYLAYLRRAFER